MAGHQIKTKPSISYSRNSALWNDFQTVYDGKSYNRSEYVPDSLEIEIKEENGEKIAFVSSAAITVSKGSSSKRGIGYLDVEEPGRLTISVSGDTDQRIFSFSRGFKMFFGLILVGVLLSMLFIFSGIGILIWGIVGLTKDRMNKRESGSFS